MLIPLGKITPQTFEEGEALLDRTEKTQLQIMSGINIIDKTVGAFSPGDVVLVTGDNQTYCMGFFYSIIVDMLANEETSLVIYPRTDTGKEQSVWMRLVASVTGIPVFHRETGIDRKFGPLLAISLGSFLEKDIVILSGQGSLDELLESDIPGRRKILVVDGWNSKAESGKAMICSDEIERSLKIAKELQMVVFMATPEPECLFSTDKKIRATVNLSDSGEIQLYNDKAWKRVRVDIRQSMNYGLSGYFQVLADPLSGMIRFPQENSHTDVQNANEWQ